MAGPVPPSLLGSTAERVVLVGDSAGGNLALAVALRCTQISQQHAAAARAAAASARHGGSC